MNEEDKNVGQAPIQETPQEEIPSTLQNNEPEKSTSGPLIGVAIIIIVLIAGGIYFWSTTVDRDELPTSQSVTETDAVVNRLNSQGTSDEIVDIEADLNTTELDSLDSDISDLLNEL